jgi:hypothetical protein
MGLDENRESLLDLEVDRRLIGVVGFSERTERRPFAAIAFGRRTEVALEEQFSPASCLDP